MRNRCSYCGQRFDSFAALEDHLLYVLAWPDEYGDPLCTTTGALDA